MLALLGLAVILAAATYLSLRRLTTYKRLVLAAVAFAITFVLPLCYILVIGDQAPPGSKVVTPGETSPGAP